MSEPGENSAPGDSNVQPAGEAEKNKEARIGVEELASPPSTAIIKLEGYFYHKEANKLTEAIESLVLKGTKNIIFDLSNTNYMNSSAIGALANSAATTKGFGGDSILMPLGATVMSVLETLGLLGMFTTASTREEAIDLLS